MAWVFLGAAGIGPEGTALGAEVMAVGRAKIVDGNVAHAKEVATMQALEKGAEAYLMQQMEGQETLPPLGRLVEEFLPEVQKRVGSFRILAEEQRSGEMVVWVRVRIGEDSLAAGARSPQGPEEGTPMPRVLVMITERDAEGGLHCWWKNPEESGGLGALEVAIRKALQAQGLEPVHWPYGPPSGETPTQEMRTCRLQKGAIQEWGRLFEADLVLYGLGRWVPGKEIYLSLRAMDVKTGAPLFGETRVESAGGEEGWEGDKDAEILGTMAEAMAQGLASKLAARSTQKEEGVTVLRVVLKGVQSTKEMTAFRDFLLKEVPGVREAKESRILRDRVTLRVVFGGGRNTFLGRLLTGEHPPFGLDIEAVNPSGIVLKVADWAS